MRTKNELWKLFRNVETSDTDELERRIEVLDSLEQELLASLESIGEESAAIMRELIFRKDREVGT